MKWKRINKLKIKVSDTGKIKSLKTNKILKTVLRAGYPAVNLYNGKQEKFYVHDLVLRAFVGKKPKGKQVNHKDAVKTNSNLENLEYVTPKQNVKHAMKHDLISIGEEHGLSKLFEDEVLKIRELYETGKFSQNKLAQKFKVDQRTIGRIVRRETWAWLTSR